MKFEDLLLDINGFGKFQIILLVISFIGRFTLPCHFMLNNFITAVPSHHCALSSLDDGGIFGNLTQEQRLVVSIPLQEDGGPSSCEMFPEPQYQLLFNSSNMTNTARIPCQNGWVYDHSTFTSTLATEVKIWTDYIFIIYVVLLMSVYWHFYLWPPFIVCERIIPYDCKI